MKRRYKSSQIPTGGKPLVAPDISPSLRREEQYRQQNQAMISAQMATNNQILAGNAKRLEQDLLYSEKQRNKFKDDVIRDAGGIWSTLAEFSPTVSKLLEDQAAQSEERAHSYDEIQAAVNYMRNGGPSEESLAIKAAVDADTAPADLAQVTRQVGADGQPGLAAKLVGHVHGANLKKAEIQFLSEAGSNYGSLAQQELTTSDDQLQFQTDDGRIVTDTVANAWASDNVVAQQAALSHVHRKVSEGFGIRNFPLDSIENSKWFDLTRQWDSVAMKRRAEAAWVARSFQHDAEQQNLLEAGISGGDPEALNNYVKNIQGHSLDGKNPISGAQILSKVKAIIPDLYRLNRISRVQIAALLENSPYFRSKEGKSFAKFHDGPFADIMTEIQTIDNEREAARRAAESAKKDSNRNAMIASATNDKGEIDGRALEAQRGKHVAQFGHDPTLDAVINSATMQVSAINAHKNRVNDMMMSGTLTEQDWKKLPFVVREKMSNQWNDYKQNLLDPLTKLGITESHKDLVRQGLGFSKEDADKKFGVTGLLVEGALRQDLMARVAQIEQDSKGTVTRSQALLTAFNAQQQDLKDVNFGGNQNKDHWFYFGPDKSFPNIQKWYSDQGLHNTPEEHKRIYVDRAKKLSTNNGGHPDAYLKLDFWGGEEGKTYLTKTLSEYLRNPYQYETPRIIQAIKANKGLTTGQVMNQLAPLVGMGQMPDPQRDHELFRSLPQATIERLQDKVNCATETSARIIGAACANTGQAMWTSTRYAEPIKAKVPDAEQQLYVGGIFDAIKFGRQSVKAGQPPTVNQTLDKWTELQGNYENLKQQFPEIDTYLQNYPEMDTASLFAALALTTGIGPVPELAQMGAPGWKQALSTYGKFAYRSTGDKRFLALTAAQPSRNLTPPVADTQVSMSLGAKPGDQLAYYPNPIDQQSIEKLNRIGRYESDSVGGYNAVNQVGKDGGHSTGSGHSGPLGDMNQYQGKFLTEMTVGEIMELQAARPGMSDAEWISQGRLHAVGRYQFTRDTFKDLVQRMGIPLDSKFDHRIQDAMGLQLHDERGYQPWVGVPARFKR